MAPRRQPTHPMDITREMVEGAFLSLRKNKAFLSTDPAKDLAKFRDEKAGKIPGRYRHYPLSKERSASIAAPLPEESFDKLDPKVAATKISQAVEHIAGATEKVQAIKSRRVVEQQKFSTAYKAPKPVAEETRERHRQAKEGIHEAKSPTTGLPIAKVRSPMALAAEVYRSRTEEQSGVTPKPKAADKSHRPTRFDEALNFGSGPEVRQALSQYCVDVMTIEGGLSENEGERVQCDKTQHARLPITESQRRSGKRLDFVRKHLSSNENYMLKLFSRMISPAEVNVPHLSMVEFARRKTEIKDDRVADGFFMGYVWALGERLHDLYRIPALARTLSLQMAA